MFLSRVIKIWTKKSSTKKTKIQKVILQLLLHNRLIKSPTFTYYSYATLILISSEYSPQNSPRQSAIAESYAEINSVIIVITSSKILLRWLFPSKIYIQFKIFNTYFSTKLSFTNKRYHLHVLEKCLYVLQEVRSIIYFRQFIHPLSLMFLNSFFHLIFFRSRTRCYRVWSSCPNVLISMTLFRKKENAKVLVYALDSIHIIFVILWLC